MKEKIYSRSIANAISSFLTEDDWNYSFDEKNGLFKFGLCIKGKIKKISYIIDVKKDEFITYAVSPLGADAEDETMMASMAEFVCRANYGLKNGNFEMDMSDGEIRFKCFVDCEGITPTQEMVKNSIHCPAAMFDRYSAGIVDIIFGNSTAKEAIAKCEKAPEEELRAILEEELDRDGDMEAMLSRLAERFGIDESRLRLGHGQQADGETDGESDGETDDRADDEADGETDDRADDEPDIKTDLFAAKGGAA